MCENEQKINETTFLFFPPSQKNLNLHCEMMPALTESKELLQTQPGYQVKEGGAWSPPPPVLMPGVKEFVFIVFYPSRKKNHFFKKMLLAVGNLCCNCRKGKEQKKKKNSLFELISVGNAAVSNLTGEANSPEVPVSCSRYLKMKTELL